eukprot:g63183.t1
MEQCFFFLDVNDVVAGPCPTTASASTSRFAQDTDGSVVSDPFPALSPQTLNSSHDHRSGKQEANGNNAHDDFFLHQNANLSSRLNLTAVRQSLTENESEIRAFRAWI